MVHYLALSNELNAWHRRRPVSLGTVLASTAVGRDERTERPAKQYPLTQPFYAIVMPHIISPIVTWETLIPRLSIRLSRISPRIRCVPVLHAWIITDIVAGVAGMAIFGTLVPMIRIATKPVRILALQPCVGVLIPYEKPL